MATGAESYRIHSRIPESFSRFSVPNSSANAATSQVGIHRARALNHPTRFGGGPISVHSSRTGGDNQYVSANLVT